MYSINLFCIYNLSGINQSSLQTIPHLRALFANPIAKRNTTGRTKFHWHTITPSHHKHPEHQGSQTTAHPQVKYKLEELLSSISLTLTYTELQRIRLSLMSADLALFMRDCQCISEHQSGEFTTITSESHMHTGEEDLAKWHKMSDYQYASVPDRKCRVKELPFGAHGSKSVVPKHSSHGRNVRRKPPIPWSVAEMPRDTKKKLLK